VYLGIGLDFEAGAVSVCPYHPEGVASLESAMARRGRKQRCQGWGWKCGKWVQGSMDLRQGSMDLRQGS